MSGGNWEYVMGNMVNTNKQFFIGNSEFTTSPDYMYYDRYSVNKNLSIATNGKLGDATKEILLKLENNTSGGWNDDYSSFVTTTAPWFTRGGVSGINKAIGIFAFTSTLGGGQKNISSRAVLTGK